MARKSRKLLCSRIDGEYLQLFGGTCSKKSARRLQIAGICSLWPSLANKDHGIFVTRRLTELAAIGEVRVLRPIPWFPVLRPMNAGQRSVENELAVDDRRMFYFPLVMKHLDSYWVERCVGRAARGWTRAEWPDLIDAHFGFPTGVGCFRVGRRLGIPVFITLRGVEQSDIRHPRIGPQLVEALTHCAGVIAVSDSLKRAAVEHGVPEEQVQVIPNAIDVERFQPGNQRGARSRLGLPTDGKIVVSVGSLIKRKRHHVLVEAFGRIRDQFKNSRLIIVGGKAQDPGYPQFLRRRINQLGLRESVTLAGPAVPDAIADWLHAADVFSLATDREGCCNAVLEALACGLPVVTTTAGDNERYVDPPRNGIIVPVDDAEELADALAAALDRKWDADAISRSVQSRGWDDVARETLEYFEERLAVYHSQRRVTASAV